MKLGVLTSGGDAPGMNAALRAVVRAAGYQRIAVAGIKHGYQGLIADDIVHLDRASVANIIQRGGTIIGTARSEEFRTEKGMRKARRMILRNHIDAIIAIGGEGTMRGADEFSAKFAIPIIGLPGTIDNDVFGTDFSIGFDTAINNALEAIDRIRDTASSLERVFFIEVMGRYAGFISLAVGLAGGAEDVLIPETPTDIAAVAETIKKNIKKGKRSNIIIVAEGDEAGSALKIAARVRKLTGEDSRVAVLGYIQRGGTPTANDRILASKLGYEAVQAAGRGQYGIMLGETGGQLSFTPFRKTYTEKKSVDFEQYRILKILAS